MKIFLGATSGVGTTYAMLSKGLARREAGTDVVIGIVETNGRAATAALVAGQEVVPRREGAHLGRISSDMDLDAILARRPQLALVDELAHSNAPGSRHSKRWQDVEELLAAGIDVWSTLTIQHVESLTDVVASLTQERVNGTVPDQVIERAEIELVDIPPDELIERWRAGRTDVPGEVADPFGHPLSRAKLSMLRELTFRRAAQAINARSLGDLQTQDPGPRSGGERIVVAVGEFPGADGLVRAAKRLADALHAPWTAVHVETPRHRRLGPAEQQRVAAAMALATHLGGQVASVPAKDVLDGLNSFVADARPTQLVFGKSVRSRWFEMRHGSVVDRLVRETPNVAVHVLPLEDQEAGGVGRSRPVAMRERDAPGAYAWTTLMVAGVTAAALALLHVLALGNVALLYLLPVMVAASLFGLRPGLFAGLLSSLAYNYVFLPPTGTLTISKPENIVSVVVLLGVAVATSQLTARVRAQADLATSSARSNAVLAGFLRQLTALGDRDAVARAICSEIARLLHLRVVLLTSGPTGLALTAASGDAPDLGAMDLTAAQWASDTGKPAGRGSGTLAASDWLFQPLAAGDRVLAVLGLAREDGGEAVRSDRYSLLMSLVDQAALTLERMRLEEETRDLDAVRERDRLRAALLSSVGHDLRTPLTSVLTAAGELARRGDDPLVATIEREAVRLSRFVENLLDMTRVEAGAMPLAIEPVDLTDAVAAALHDARRSLDGHEVLVDVPPDLPLVRVDPQLFHHCLLNLLDNAGRYGDPGTPVAILGERDGAGVTLTVLDHGPGLPPGKEQAVFETFRRLAGSDRAPGGTGLGLAIVKGFADAMGLRVDAATRTDTAGACFSLRFPEPLLVQVSASA